METNVEGLIEYLRYVRTRPQDVAGRPSLSKAETDVLIEKIAAVLVDIGSGWDVIKRAYEIESNERSRDE